MSSESNSDQDPGRVPVLEEKLVSVYKFTSATPYARQEAMEMASRQGTVAWRMDKHKDGGWGSEGGSTGGTGTGQQQAAAASITSPRLLTNEEFVIMDDKQVSNLCCTVGLTIQLTDCCVSAGHVS